MENNKKNRIIKYTFLLGLFLVVLGTSYALFTVTLTGKKLTRIRTAKVSLELLDENNNNIEKTDNNEYEYSINLENAVPETDENGKAHEGFKFKLKNSGTIPTKYVIYLDDLELESGEQRIDDRFVKYSLIKNGEEEDPTVLMGIGENPNRKLDVGIIEANETNEYELHIWIQDKADNDAISKAFNTGLRVEGVQYVDKIDIKEGTLADTLVNQGIKETLFKINGKFNSEKEESGLYKYIDEKDKETYFYRGTEVNNYVDFAGSIWKVLRIQEDGTVKLIKDDYLNYPSDKATVNTKGETLVQYSSNNSAKYQGSNVESYINEWYNAEMINYDDKIATNEYCNDLEELPNSFIYKAVDFAGSGSHPLNYSGIYGRMYLKDWYARLNATSQDIGTIIVSWNKDNNQVALPSISCRSDDKVNSKVALITSDEVYLIGSTNSFISKNNSWTMSLYQKLSPDDNDSVYSNTKLGNVSVNNKSHVLPVITLKSNVVVSSGNGTSDKPYVIE